MYNSTKTAPSIGGAGQYLQTAPAIAGAGQDSTVLFMDFLMRSPSRRRSHSPEDRRHQRRLRDDRRSPRRRSSSSDRVYRSGRQPPLLDEFGRERLSPSRKRRRSPSRSRSLSRRERKSRRDSGGKLDLEKGKDRNFKNSLWPPG
eukprot:7390151-Prymnesium_polylepis.1